MESYVQLFRKTSHGIVQHNTFAGYDRNIAETHTIAVKSDYLRPDSLICSNSVFFMLCLEVKLKYRVLFAVCSAIAKKAAWTSQVALCNDSSCLQLDELAGNSTMNSNQANKINT